MRSKAPFFLLFLLFLFTLRLSLRTLRLCGESSSVLRQQLADHPAGGHEGERPAEPVADFQVRLDAQAVIQGCDDVSGGDRVAARPAADAVAGAVDVSPLEPAARQHQAVAEVPVVATGRSV